MHMRWNWESMDSEHFGMGAAEQVLAVVCAKERALGCQEMEVLMGGHGEMLEPSMRALRQLDVPVGIPLNACDVLKT